MSDNGIFQILYYFCIITSLARYSPTLEMSATSTSAAVSQIEPSLRNRQEDTDVVPIVQDDNDILEASRLADSTVPDGGVG
jgi:hypothetical protein